MKKGLTFLFFYGLCQTMYAQCYGIFESYIIIGGASGQYYDLQATTGNPDFNGANLGTFVAGSTLRLWGGEMKVYRDNGCGFGSGAIDWRVYPTGSPSGSYTVESVFYNSTLCSNCSCGNGSGNNNEGWLANGANTNVMSGLTAGNYTIEVYGRGVTGCGTAYSSNGGSNYKATFTVSAPAPIALRSFDGRKNGAKAEVLLTWETETEHNNDQFIIARSTDGIRFEAIGTVKGNGNSRVVQAYEFVDLHPKDGTLYYRLQDVSFDGKTNVSKTVAVQFSSKGLIRVYPNPIQNETLRFDYTAMEDAPATGMVMDVLGRVHLQSAYELAKGLNNIEINLATLPAGQYFLQIGAERMRFVKTGP